MTRSMTPIAKYVCIVAVLGLQCEAFGQTSLWMEFRQPTNGVINPDGFVRLEIRQEVSGLTDSTIAVGPGLTAPIFSLNVAETVVTVRDNETVVLGGLIESRDSKVEQKIPLMGDMPVRH